MSATAAKILPIPNVQRMRAEAAADLPHQGDDSNVLHPVTALQMQRARLQTARSVRADIAMSVDRAEALRRADTYIKLLDEHHTHLARVCAAICADEE